MLSMRLTRLGYCPAEEMSGLSVHWFTQPVVGTLRAVSCNIGTSSVARRIALEAHNASD